jgi:hypothetical protein
VEEFRNLAVMPGDENGLAVRLGMDFIGNRLHILAFEPDINGESERVAEGFQGEARAMAALRIGGGKEVVRFQGLAVNGKIFEIDRVGTGAGFAIGGQTKTLLWFFGVPDHENNGVFQPRIFGGGRFGKKGAGNGEGQYGTDKQAQFHFRILLN